MDESLQELVSRYIDGDLDDAESARVEARADTDAELAAEIEAALEIRSAVAALAAGMEPPVALDPVMEPLRQSAPVPDRVVRPLYRWLGAAAAVVLGVSVAVEVVRRNPEPALRQPASSHDVRDRDREEIFELAPLPSAIPDDNRPLGAADHLLEEKPPPPSAPEPAPLEVIGPLPTDESTTIGDGSHPPPEHEEAREDGDRGDMVLDSLDESARQRTSPPTESSAGAVAPAPAKAARSFAREDRAVLAEGAGKERSEAVAETGRESDATTDVIVRIDGVEVRTGSRLSCSDGARPVRVEVLDGRVVSIEPLTRGNGSGAGDECPLDDLVGLSLPGVGDGSHTGDVVIGKPSP